MFAEKVREDAALADCRETVTGLNETDIPFGGEAERVTLPEKDELGVRVRVVITPEPPACRLGLLGELDMVKSHGMYVLVGDE